MKIPALILAMLLPLAMRDCGLCYGAPMLSSSPFATHTAYFDVTTFPWSATDAQITAAFNVCAKLLAPFDVNLTTILPPPQPNVAWVVLGGPLGQPGNIAGQSVVGNYTVGTQYNTPGNVVSAFAARVFADGLGNDNALQIGWAAAHELGHQWWLYHQADGVMQPILGTELPLVPWPNEVNSLGLPQDSYAILGGEIGFAPEPCALMLTPLLMMLFEDRINRAVAVLKHRTALTTYPVAKGQGIMADSHDSVTHEVWKPIIGYEELYEVSNQGRVKSVARYVRHPHSKSLRVRERMLTCDSSQLGHLRVTLCKEGRHDRQLVHRIVLAAFSGPCPEGFEACHGDGNPKNNRVENLRWDTHKNNAGDMIKHGRVRIGTQNHQSKLTENQVKEIRRLRENEGISFNKLASQFGVTKRSIQCIIKRKLWKSVA